MQNYHNLVSRILDYGKEKQDRTGTGTLSIFNHQLEYDLEKGYPLLSTKKVSWRNVISELCFFVNGDSNIAELHKDNNTIWDEWANENGDLGRVYGVQWRAWRALDGNVYDQLGAVYNSLKYEPDSRRHIVSAWNVGELNQMALPPCHLLFQFYVDSEGYNKKLSLKITMRSVDVFLGLPYNIASYAALVHLFAQMLGYDVGVLIMDLGDCHIYKNHIAQCEELLKRDPDKYALPQLRIETPCNFLSERINLRQFDVVGYESYPAIKAPIAV
jgi:thymidylate synthase